MMKSLKKLIAMGLVAALSVSLVAWTCWKKRWWRWRQRKPEGKKKIEVIIRVPTPLLKQMQVQIKQLKNLNVEITFQGPDNESALHNKQSFLNTAIEKKPAAIALAALSTDAQLDAVIKKHLRTKFKLSALTLEFQGPLKDM